MCVSRKIFEQKGAKVSGRLHSISEAAAVLGVSKFTVRRLIDAGEIKAVNVAARRMIPSSEVDRVMVHGTGRARQRKGEAGAQAQESATPVHGGMA